MRRERATRPPRLARLLVKTAVWFLPPESRGRYQDEWLAELDEMEREHIAPLLPALRILLGAPAAGHALRTYDQRRGIGERLATAVSYAADGRGRSAPRVSVIVPALNEARNLPSVLGRLPADVYEVIVVDGHSTDGTVDVARRHRPDVRVVQQTRRGKGNAMACGFAAATGDIVVTLDADGLADPGEIPAFVDALLTGAHFAKGSRFIGHGDSADLTRLRRVGNELLNLCVRPAFRSDYTDLCCGYTAFWSACLPVLEVSEPVIEVPAGAQVDQRRTSKAVRWGDGFEIETLISIRIHTAGLSVVEVPTFEHLRMHGASNLNAVRDGLRVLGTIAAERLRRHRKARLRIKAREVGKPWQAFARTMPGG